MFWNVLQEMAGETGDRLLGVCGFVHRVLVEAQLPLFRCCQAINAPLTYWFDSKPVTAYLQARILSCVLPSLLLILGEK